MSQPHCATCGEPIKYNKFKAHSDRPPSDYFPEGLKKGQMIEAWSHADGMKRDHLATPADNRTFEAESIRRSALEDQAKAHVKRVLQSNFDYLNAEKRVNDLFHDRRAD